MDRKNVNSPGSRQKFQKVLIINKIDEDFLFLDAFRLGGNRLVINDIHSIIDERHKYGSGICFLYCPRLILKWGNSTCNFTFACSALNTRIKVSMVTLLALLSILDIWDF